MSEPLYSIGIVVHNQLEMTKKCLASLSKSKDIEQCQIIVVDNASTDQTVNWLMGGYLEPVFVHKMEENIGVGAGYNQALAMSAAPYFISLNNDIEVHSPDWLKVMREKLESNPNIALVGVSGSCNQLDDRGCGSPGPRIDYVEGSIMMGRTALLKEHGLFDPIYRFAYCEDSDLSLRMRKLGYEIALVDVQHTHHRGVTSSIAKIDLRGLLAYNMAVFRKRWGKYLKTHTFTERIAIRRVGALGDAICVTPILREIKKRNAYALIDIFTQCTEVFSGNPNVNEVIPPTNPRFGDVGYYDRSFFLDGAYEHRPGFSIVDGYAEECGLKITDKRPELFVQPYADKTVKEILRQDPWMVVHPSSGQDWMGKNWRISSFDAVLQNMRRKGYKIVLVGYADYSPLPCDLDWRGKTSFDFLVATIANAQLFLGVDSGPMHVARAVGTPAVCIFGSTDPQKIVDGQTDNFRSVTAPFEKIGCLGCHHITPNKAGVPCIAGHDFCMDAVTAEQVMEAIESLSGIEVT